MRRNCRNVPDQVRAQAEATAASIIAQGRLAALDSQSNSRLAARDAQSNSRLAAQDSKPAPPAQPNQSPRQGQGHPVAVAEPEEEPMNRYINPIPTPRRQPACPTMNQNTQDRILETLCCQNQLLLDLLAAVNALTVAMLNRRDHTDGGAVHTFDKS